MGGEGGVGGDVAASTEACLCACRGTDEAALRGLLAPFGEMDEVTIIKDKASGESKGGGDSACTCMPHAACSAQ